MRRFLLVATGLARRTWVITAIAVASCAAFAARATTSFVVAGYLGPSPRSPEPARLARLVPPVGRTASTTERRRAAAQQLVERNMFCSTCGPATDAPATNLALTLAVLIETSLGREPRATVRVLASEVQGTWAVGEAIPGLGRLDRIAYTWIDVIDTTGHRGRLSLLDPTLGPTVGSVAGRGSDPARSESPPAAAPWAARIKKLGDQDYEVDRDLVRELVTGAARPGGMRWVPILDNGEVRGIRLLGVNPDSIPFALGLHTGDALTTIDGAPLKDINQLLDLYSRLNQLTAVELSGTRTGKPIVRTLHLR